jgi:hypothetical protein
MKRIASLVVLILVTLAFAGCGGSPQSQPGPTKQSQPLDPQGNWLFTFINNPGDTVLVVAGQLYELNPPTVTSNPMGTPLNQPGCDGSFTFNGQASGTDSISLTAQQINSKFNTKLNLTGTIAADQAHMSGAWTTEVPGCLGGTGTWSAQLLTAMTGNWSGTLSNATTNLTVTATLTENTDQTTTNMGMVTGTITLLGSPCFASADTFNIPPWNATSTPSFHAGEMFILISTSPDAEGVTISTSGPVDPGATTFTPLGFTIHGGACDGQNFTGTLSR